MLAVLPPVLGPVITTTLVSGRTIQSTGRGGRNAASFSCDGQVRLVGHTPCRQVRVTYQ